MSICSVYDTYVATNIYWWGAGTFTNNDETHPESVLFLYSATSIAILFVATEYSVR